MVAAQVEFEILLVSLVVMVVDLISFIIVYLIAQLVFHLSFIKYCFIVHYFVIEKLFDVQVTQFVN